MTIRVIPPANTNVSPQSPLSFNGYGWSVDPTLIGQSFSKPQPFGSLVVYRFTAVKTGIPGHVVLSVSAAGTSLTSGQNFVGIYDTGYATANASCTLLLNSANLSTTWNSTGIKNITTNAASGQSGTLTAGRDYYVAILANGTGTAPEISSIGTASLGNFMNQGFSGAFQLRSGLLSSAGTSLPTTFNGALSAKWEVGLVLVTP